LRSWAVKKAREVFLLPEELVGVELGGERDLGRWAYYVPLSRSTGVLRFYEERMLGSRR
jgi:hypothetical protein